MKILRDVLWYNTAKCLAIALSILRGLFLAKLLGPSAFGIWSVFHLTLKYSDSSHLGFRHAVNREVPILRGRGETAASDEVLGVGFFWNMVLTLAAGTGVFLWGSYSFGDNSVYQYGFQVTAGVIVLAQLTSFLNTTLRVNREFQLFGVMTVVAEALTFTFFLLLVPFWGVMGALTALALSYALYLCLFAGLRPATIVFLASVCKKDVSKAKDLLKIGFPVVIFSLLVVGLYTIDKLLVLKILGRHAFGMYSFAGVVVSLLLVVVGNIDYVLYPSLGEEFGKEMSGKLRAYVVLSSTAFAHLCAPCIAVGALILPWILLTFFPEYLESLLPMALLMVGSYFLVFTSIPASSLIVMNRYVGYGLFSVGAVLLNAAFTLLFLRVVGEIWGAALGAALSYAGFGIARYLYALIRLKMSLRESLLELAKNVVPLLFNSAVVAVVLWTAGGLPFLQFSGHLSLPETLVAVMAVLVLNLPFFYYVDRQTRIFRRIGAVLFPHASMSSH